MFFDDTSLSVIPENTTIYTKSHHFTFLSNVFMFDGFWVAVILDC